MLSGNGRGVLVRAAAASWRRKNDETKTKGAKPAEILAAELEGLADSSK